MKEVLQINEQEVSNSYRDYLHARQQKKIMEKLREKKTNSYKEEKRKHDLRSQDEQYVSRHRLRQGREDEGGDYNEE